MTRALPKKLFAKVLILFYLLFLLSGTLTVFAAISDYTNVNTREYTLLEPSVFTNQGPTINPVDYFSKVYTWALGATVVIAVLMIVIGGVEYTAGGISESVKSDAKDRITKALIALLIAFMSWLLLNTINPELVAFKFLSSGGGLLGPGPSGTTPPPAPRPGPAGAPTSGQECFDYWRPGLDGMREGKTSPKIESLINFVEQSLGGNKSVLGETSTFDKSNPDCNQTRGSLVCGLTECSHRRDSKHYGKESFRTDYPSYYGSNAVDFGMGGGIPDNTKQWGDRVISYARQWANSFGGNNFDAFCESPAGARVLCDSGRADHVHIEIWPVP